MTICVTHYTRWTCAGMQECSWQVRCILDRDPRCKRACLARAVLFLPSGRSTSVGGVALHGAESCQGWACLRTGEPECWPWSSAVVHCGKTQAVPWLADSLWRNRWTVAAWRDYLAASEAESDLAAIRRCTHTGRPLGDAAFISKLEQTTGRRLKNADGTCQRVTPTRFWKPGHMPSLWFAIPILIRGG